LPIRGITICVEYDDILAVTLPLNLQHFTELVVVTSDKDEKTVALCKEFGDKVCVLQTDAFYRNGAKFNKGLAMEEGFDFLGRKGWTLIWDADIVFPSTMKLANIRQGHLYSPRRRILEDVSKFSPTLDWLSLPLRHDKEHYGYFQLFHASDPVLWDKPWYDPTWTHAGGSDAMFQEKWNKDLRLRPMFEVLHLGPCDRNWFGRTTDRLDGETVEQAALRLSNMQAMFRLRKAQPKYPMRGLPSERLPNP
jgi:hypothetical protein